MKNKIISLFKNLKEFGKSEPIGDTAILRVITETDVCDKSLIKALAEWRKRYERWFPSQFKVTEEGTKKWLKNLVISVPDRILFMVETHSGEMVGHLGLNRFNFKTMTCEIDNVVRGNDKLLPGIMTKALEKIIEWSFSELKVKTLYLRTFSDNERAVRFYKRAGFNELKKIPLKRVIKDKEISWVEMPKASKSPVNRYYVQMYLKRPL